MNPKLITWDYNKDATVTLEDALLSFESARFMLGGKIRKSTDADTTVKINLNEAVVIETENTLPKVINHLTGKEYETQPTVYKYINLTTGERGSVHPGNSSVDPVVEAETLKAKVGDNLRIFWTEEVTGAQSEAAEIVISPDMFPGTYRVVGDTFMRSEATSKDEAFQFIIGKAKVLSNTTITLQAEGDPSTNGLLNVEVKAFELRERLKDFFYQLAIAI